MLLLQQERKQVMLLGLSPLAVVTAVVMVAVGAQQLMAPDGVAVAGVQVGGVDITVPVMAIHMLLATMLHPWFTQAPR